MARRVVALILAAGQGRRMGQMKQLLPYRGRAMVQAVIETALASSADGAIVVANPVVEEAIGGSCAARCRVVVNHDPQSQMLASVQLGVTCARSEFALRDEDGLAVLLADQPQVDVEVIDRVLAVYRSASATQIAIATYEARRGHPAVYPMELLSTMNGWAPDARLSDLSRLHGERVCECLIPGLPQPLDVNTPEDYKRLKA